MFKFLLILIPLLLSATTTKLEHIELQLDWKHQFEFAGYYIAKEKGFYTKAGLDVDIQEYNKNINILKKVENSKNGGIYGISYPSIILHKANGANITLISAMEQLSPHVLLTLKSSNIHSIEEFKDKRIMSKKEALSSASFLAMINAHNLKINDLIQLQPTFNIDSLIKHKTDIFSAYLSNEPYQLQQKNIPYNVWNPADYGFDFYDDILFTSLRELQLHPLRVEAFKKASLKGWRYAYSHIEETIELILQKYNTQYKTKEALLYEANELKKLAFIDGNKIGDLEINKIKRILDIYTILGLVKQNIQLKDFIYTSNKNFLLTSQEKKYLKNKKSLKLCIDPNWMPYESFLNGKYIGMSADYFKLIKNKFHLDIDVIKTETWDESLEFAKNRKCDMLSLSMQTEERSKYLNFTSAYLKIPLVIATKNSALFINNFKMLKGKKLAITKGYAFKDILEKKYPYLNLVDVENIEDGLSRVKQGEFYAYIGTLMSIGYTIQKEFFGELKISGKFNNTWDLGIAVRDDDAMLLQIMQKAVLSIDEKEKQKIINDWLSIEYVEDVNYSMFFTSIGISSIIIFIIWFLYRRERQLKQELEIKNIVFDTIINTIENPIFYKDVNGVYQNANKTFTKDILGIERDELVGKKLEEFSYLIPQNELDFYNAQDKKLYTSKSNQVYETKVQLKNGFVKDFRIQKNLFYSKDGNILGYVGFMYDITDIKKREEELKLMASTDHMTKLYNRRYFSQMGNDLLKLAKRERTALSIIMLDIDDFKKINDTYGHNIGDDVIISIANTLLLLSRESDVVCRFGGEEFILLLPNTETKGAKTIANKIRTSIENIQIPLDTSTNINVTVSIGLSLVNPQKKQNLEESIKEADEALYKAKEGGKNRVEIYTKL